MQTLTGTIKSPSCYTLSILLPPKILNVHSVTTNNQNSKTTVCAHGFLLLLKIIVNMLFKRIQEKLLGKRTVTNVKTF